MNNTKWLGAAAAVVVVVLLAVWWGQTNKSTSQPTTSTTPDQTQTQQPPKSSAVKLSSNASMGNFLVDSRGMTLYYFPKDFINKSNCAVGQCLTAWPVFYSADTAVASPLQKADFGQITRDDNAKQSTYKGWPLYYYFKDTKPGDTLGEGVGDVWYILPEPFYTVMTQNQESVGGNYLVDQKGMTLYTFTSDKQGTATTPPVSNCSDKCLAAWPVFNTTVIAPSLMKNSDFTSFKRADGVTQLAYKGWPLYHYATDKKSGDVLGQNFNKVWFVAKP